jgi:hypothetical protein
MPASDSQTTTPRPRADGANVPDGQPAAQVIRVSSPASLLAAIPVVLRFQPSEPSIVVLGTTPPRSAVALTLRYDIPRPQHAGAIARHAASLLGAQGIKTACAVGYGPGDLVTQVAETLRAQFAKAGIAMQELLRVQDGRYWSYVCADPGCCPPEGTTFDLKAHPVTREHATLVLASREALAATVAPVTGDAAESMRKATRNAQQRATRLITRAGQQGQGHRARRRALLQPGLKAVADALGLYRAGLRFESCKDAAWLALALQSLQVRDDAWARMLPEHREAHQRLWTDLATLARPGYVAAPAALLAFTAWQDGDGALANVALDRALADNPHYSMALLLREALDAGAPPSMARLPMTPEEVAACYDENEKAGKDEDAGQAADPERTGDDGGQGGEDNDGETPGSAGEDNDADAPGGALAGAPA